MAKEPLLENCLVNNKGGGGGRYLAHSEFFSCYCKLVGKLLSPIFMNSEQDYCFPAFFQGLLRKMTVL